VLARFRAHGSPEACAFSPHLSRWSPPTSVSPPFCVWLPVTLCHVAAFPASDSSDHASPETARSLASHVRWELRSVLRTPLRRFSLPGSGLRCRVSPGGRPSLLPANTGELPIPWDGARAPRREFPHAGLLPARPRCLCSGPPGLSVEGKMLRVPLFTSVRSCESTTEDPPPLWAHATGPCSTHVVEQSAISSMTEICSASRLLNMFAHSSKGA